jgi:hypothetical protein
VPLLRYREYESGGGELDHAVTAESDGLLDERGSDNSPRLAMVQRGPIPVTVVDLWKTAAGTNIELGLRFSRLGGIPMT